MSRTLRGDNPPKRSEMSFGAGLVKNPNSDFQSARSLVFPQGDDKTDLTTEYRASLRTDATVADDVIIPDMLYVEGNPDAFGPGPALVQTEPVRPQGNYPQPRVRGGVTRDC